MRPGSASGKCVPGRVNMGPNDPINIFAAWPHMHKTGTRMSTIINRVGGGQEVLIDKPFNFASQLSYPTPRRCCSPDDTLQTTCYCDNTTTGAIGFGPSTAQEMCYDFLYAYPAHALDHPPILGPIVTSAASNLCVGRNGRATGSVRRRKVFCPMRPGREGHVPRAPPSRVPSARRGRASALRANLRPR